MADGGAWEPVGTDTTGWQPVAPVGPREGHGVWDAMVAGVQGTGSAILARGKMPDVVLDPHHAKWYENALSSVAAIGADVVPEVAGALAGSPGGPIGMGVGTMAVPAEIRESLARAYQNGEADSSTSFLGRIGIIIKGLKEPEVLKATAKAGLIGGLTMGAGKFAAPLGKLAQIGAETSTLAIAPAALEGHLPEMQDFANAAILVGGMHGASAVASRMLSVYAKTGVRPEQIVADAKDDPTIAEDLQRPTREWTGAPTKDELLAQVKMEEKLLPGDDPAVLARLKEHAEQVHKETLADPARVEAMAKDVGISVDEMRSRLEGTDIPRAYRGLAIEENTKAAVPGVKAQEFADQPFADVPQADGEPTKPTHVNYNYINTQPEVEGALSRLSTLYRDEIQQQRRGTVSNAQTYAEAGDILNRMIGGEDSTVKQMRGSLATDHEIGARVLAKKQLAVGAAESVMKMRDAYIRNPTADNKLQYLASIERSATILSNFLGERAEIGRALEILKNTKTDAERAKQLSDLIEAYKTDPDKLAIAMGMMDEPGAILRASSKAVKATLWDKLIEYFKASIVSGPWTHIANLSGNTAFAAMRPAIEQVGAAMGMLRGGEDRVLMIQPLSRVIGNINGAFEIAKLASKIYELEGAKGVVKAAWSSGNRSQKAEVAQGGAIGGTLGKVVRSSFQVLGAEDALFKTLNERGELYSLASKVATQEGLSPLSREFWNRVGEVVSTPSEAQMNAAKDAGLRLTFNLPLGEKGKAAQTFIKALKLQWAAPFTQTPGNIAKEMLRMTPFAPAIGEWRAAFVEGGAARDKALAELAVGSALMTATFALARAGIITGSATGTPGERNVKEAAGIQPMSVKIGSEYYDISRIQPIGTIVVMAADIATIWDKFEEGEQDKVPKIVATAFANAITNQTMLQGLTMFVNALSEPDRFFPRMAQSYAGAMVPFSGLMRQTGEALDKEQRRIDGIKDAVIAAIPLYRESLLPKINVMTGEPMATKERVIGQKATPESMDKVLTEAVRLGVGVSKAPKNIQLPSPDKKIGKVELTPEQQNLFTTAAGKMAHEILGRVVSSPMWEEMGDLQKKKVFATVFKDARKRGAIAALPGDKRAEMAQDIEDQLEESMK